MSLSLCAAAHTAAAQTAPPSLEPTPIFALPTGALTLRQPAIPNRPFTVSGTSGAILGMQSGSVELWQWPLKFFSALELHAEVEGYPVPIDLNAAVATLDVSPDHSTITYSHAALTVRQHMFVPAGPGSEGLGGMIVFEIESVHPVTLTVSLRPEMKRMWPAPQFGQPGWDWRPLGHGGGYVISTDNPALFGFIAMPQSTPGYVSPYQERPTALPIAFRVHFNPATDTKKLFPLLCEAARPGETNSAEGISALQQRVIAKAAALPQIFERTRDYYAHYFDQRLVVHTPDPKFDQAIAWAELAIDKSQVTTARGETGLVAGLYPSFDSARPGFGWFFGRDTLWSIYAINGYGDPALTRRVLDFLIKRQRADGKMMHEYSQSADTLSGDMAWSNFPYEYASADSTPLYLLAMQDYVRSTGDLAYLKSHWDSIKLAYHFERTHDADGDGVYDNSQGTGWVEGWPPRLPQQELYLAALDRDATGAMQQLAAWMGDDALAKDAVAVAIKLRASVENYHRADGTYAFSKNSDGSYDPTLTVYPAVAMWNDRHGFDHPETMLTRWSSSIFATDWGVRAVAATDPVFDPMSYHQGTVWPLFTGWAAMAQYHGGRPLAAWSALQQNINLTWVQDPGAVTEVISGSFYQPLGRSSTHQLWSSAMVLAPAIRGMFGLVPDATNHALSVDPHLPASWREATLQNVRVAEDLYTIVLQRNGVSLDITATSATPTVLCLRGPAGGEVPCHEAAAAVHTLRLALPDVEVALAPAEPIEFGAETSLPRVIDEQHTAHSLTLRLEAKGGTTVDLILQRNRASAVTRSESADVHADRVRVSMPAGDGFTQKEVTLTW